MPTMRWMKSLLLMGGLALTLSACPSRCREACENAKTVCGDQLVGFDVDTCASNCEANLDGCKNQDEQASCVADAKACGEIRACPGCLD